MGPRADRRRRQRRDRSAVHGDESAECVVTLFVAPDEERTMTADVRVRCRGIYATALTALLSGASASTADTTDLAVS